MADKGGHIGVYGQKQAGLNYLGLVLPVGRLTSGQMRGLAEISERFGSGTLRLTVWQNLLISDVADRDVGICIAAINALGLGIEASAIRRGLVACTGNAGCKFSASNTKGHALRLADYLEMRVAVDLPINIHLTGCHHSCAQHYVGDIGLLACKVEQGEESVEGYHVYIGGGAASTAEQAMADFKLPEKFKGYNIAAEGFGGMDNNCFGVSLVATIGPAVALFMGAKKWWEKALAAGAAALILHTILLTFSRGAMVGLLIVGFTAFLLMPKRPKQLAVLALLGLIALRLTGPQLMARYATAVAQDEERDASAESRFDLWRDCLKIFSEKPVFGVGPGNFRVVAASLGWAPGKQAHSTWMQALATRTDASVANSFALDAASE
jgi:hypothetical protein